MKKIGTVTFLVIICLFSSHAQEKQTIKERLTGVNIETLPYYNFGKGVGLTSPDSLFQFNIRFRMQNRLHIEKNKEDGWAYQANIRRLRLRFDGYVGSPKFLYVIQLSFAPGDVGQLQDGGNINIIRDAMVVYKANENWSFGFGQTKLPGNRQRVNSSGALQLTDRSINNAAYNIDRDFGFQTTFSNVKNNQLSYHIKGAISTGKGRNFTNKNKGIAYTLRGELYPLGKFNGNGEFFEGDLKREEKPKLYLGTTYHLNEKAQFTQGQRGNSLFEEKNITSILADAVFKYNGWATMLSYMQRTTNHPVTINPNNPSEIAYVFVGHGYDLQTSYTFPNFWEIIGRYSFNKTDYNVRNFYPIQNQYTIGITKYIWEHAFKAQLELTKTNSQFLNGKKSDDWYVRFQIEIGI